MEEKLQEILNKAKEDHLRLEEKVNGLRNKIQFCFEHKFQEETRIATLELNAIEMPAYRQGKIIEEIQALLNAWNS